MADEPKRNLQARHFREIAEIINDLNTSDFLEQLNLHDTPRTIVSRHFITHFHQHYPRFSSNRFRHASGFHREDPAPPQPPPTPPPSPEPPTGKIDPAYLNTPGTEETDPW